MQLKHHRTRPWGCVSASRNRTNLGRPATATATAFTEHLHGEDPP
jgi:hypothetical protein